MKTKRLLTAVSLAGVFGLTLFAGASIAGPLMLGPIKAPMPMPKAMVKPMNTIPIQKQVLNTYREIRSFWLSRAIVR